mmetsp:Transcript_44736/g.57296  ORF Transcript_44736/g.57296 Transcript_44736/m.57296 type:complete len:291 (+) Transcript_44736:87-959(+)
MVLRSAVHTVRGGGKNRAKNAPNVPEQLPLLLRTQHLVEYDIESYDLPNSIVSMIEQVNREELSIGEFHDKIRLENFDPGIDAYKDTQKQEALFRYISTNANFLGVYTRLLEEIVIPHLDHQLDDVLNDEDETNETQTFWCQFPPTLRIQPGPSTRYGRPHNDAEYGHQIGEVNFWLPLTDYSETQTALWVESEPGLGDFHPLDCKVGSMTAFHGTLCKHHAAANPTTFTRASLDFRVGVGKYFDSDWVLGGTKSDHGRIPIQGRPRDRGIVEAKKAATDTGPQAEDIGN